MFFVPICSLAAISTLYFLEHSKQNDKYANHYNINDIYSERHALVNSSYGSAGIPPGGGGGSYGGYGNILIDDNTSYWKKVQR